MAQVDESWCGHEDDLKHPEADVRDGEGLVVADVLATRLLGVTGEVRLLVAPDLFSRGPQHQDPEDEEDSQPDLADDRRVLLSVLQQPPQKAPVAHASRFLAYGESTGWSGQRKKECSKNRENIENVSQRKGFKALPPGLDTPHIQTHKSTQRHD